MGDSDDERAHVNDLMRMSRRKAFVDSSDSDESVATSVQVNAIRSVAEQRMHSSEDACVQHDVLQAIDDPRIHDKIRSLHEKGFPAARSLQIGFRKRHIRRQKGVCEVFPRWFALRCSIRTWEHCRELATFLGSMHGGAWEEESQKFIADQPLPTENLSPQLQNMRSKDFMHVTLYYAMKENDACDSEDLEACKSCISEKYRVSV